ncbi:MAG: RHS repeat-associated core domain-containing protein [Planctomycetes bacterium]|nr:RHS repeat-associated core domain-containing protein [Planctomycetota bacterium]
MMEAPDCGDVDSDSNTSEVLRFSYHTQLVGSVTHVTGPTGSVVEQYLYDPYGKPTIKDGAGGTISASAIRNPYLFTARQLDEETGLYYYRARNYSPDLRRFIQRDPLEYVDGPNALAYVLNAPTTQVDPTGLRGGGGFVRPGGGARGGLPPGRRPGRGCGWGSRGGNPLPPDRNPPRTWVWTDPPPPIGFPPVNPDFLAGRGLKAIGQGGPTLCPWSAPPPPPSGPQMWCCFAASQTNGRAHTRDCGNARRDPPPASDELGYPRDPPAGGGNVVGPRAK